MNTRLVPVGQLCRLVSGRPFKPSEWTAEGLPIVRIQNLQGPDRAFHRYGGNVETKVAIRSGDLLFVSSGGVDTPFGCFLWERGPALLNQHISRVQVDKQLVDPEYFMYAVNLRLAELTGGARGGGSQCYIAKERLQHIELPLVPLAAQRVIVTRVRECLRRVTELCELRAQTQALARSVFPAHLEQVARSQSRSLPLGELLETTRSGRSIRANDNDGGATGSVLTLAAVRRPKLDLSFHKKVDLDDAVARKYQIHRGDVFISRSNTHELVGLSAMVMDEPPNRLIYPDLMLRLVPRADRLHPRFLAYALRFPEVRGQIQLRTSGSNPRMRKISGRRLREVQVPVPSLEAQAEIVAGLDHSYEACLALQASLQEPELQSLRVAALRRIFAIAELT
jgi:type I restriction enzyme, S subunit